MKRVINYSAGPAAIPLEVLEQARDEMLDWNGTGCSVMEVSHRGKVGVEVNVDGALESGQLAGYSTGVYDSDPPENTPLAKAPHVVMTPHLGASTAENLDRLGDCIVERVRKYCKK